MQITKISNVQFNNFKGQHFEPENPKQAYRTTETKKLMNSLEVLASVNAASVNKEIQIKNEVADISEKAHVYGDKLQRAEGYCEEKIEDFIYNNTDFNEAASYFRNNPYDEETTISNFNYKKEQIEGNSDCLLITRTADNAKVLFGKDDRIQGVRYRDLTIFTNGFFGLKDGMKPAVVYRNYSSDDNGITASEMYDFNSSEVYKNVTVGADGEKTYDEVYRFSNNGDNKILMSYDNNETKIEFSDMVTRYTYSQDNENYQVTTTMTGI